METLRLPVLPQCLPQSQCHIVHKDIISYTGQRPRNGSLKLICIYFIKNCVIYYSFMFINKLLFVPRISWKKKKNFKRFKKDKNVHMSWRNNNRICWGNKLSEMNIAITSWEQCKVCIVTGAIRLTKRY